MSQIACIRGGWVKRGGVVGRAAGDGLSLLLGHSEGHRLNPKDRPRQLLAAVWNHTHPY